MQDVIFYAAFLGSFISTTALIHMVIREYDQAHHQTLSEVAAYSKRNINEFRIVLWVCGTLISITMLFYIAPRLQGTGVIRAAWVAVYVCEMLLGIIHAVGGTQGKLHKVFAYTMSYGMLLTTLLFAQRLPDGFAAAEWVLLFAMLGFGLLTILHKAKFLFYEMPFIFLSHVTILIAAIALR